MDDLTRRQLRAISRAFYDTRAPAFDASRADLPWPGWGRVLDARPTDPLTVLDIGCGNGRFAAFLRDAERDFEYVGVDASRPLLAAARERRGEALGDRAQWIEQDCLDPEPAGEALPLGPYSLVVLMGLLHHVPGAEARLALLRAAAGRLAEGGLLALTTWQFADRPRFDRRRLGWHTVGSVLGSPIDPARLEPGDALLGFGDEAGAPPRYCHQVDQNEVASWPAALGLRVEGDFRADGAEGDLNRYLLLAHA